jgi:hypothetical protein
MLQICKRGNKMDWFFKNTDEIILVTLCLVILIFFILKLTGIMDIKKNFGNLSNKTQIIIIFIICSFALLLIILQVREM